jgi:hypothetical protein
MQIGGSGTGIEAPFLEMVSTTSSSCSGWIYPFFIKEKFPHFQRAQQQEKDEVLRVKIKEKLSTIWEKGYVSKMEVKSLMSFFAIHKGEDDIRMVYDASQSELNDALWAPNFQLPTADILARGLGLVIWM